MLQAESQYFFWMLSVVKGLTLFINSTVSTVITLHAFSKLLPESLALPQPCRQGEEHEVPLDTPLGCSAAQWLMLHLSVSPYLV